MPYVFESTDGRLPVLSLILLGTRQTLLRKGKIVETCYVVDALNNGSTRSLPSLPIDLDFPPPMAGYNDRHLTQQKKGNRKRFRPRCGRHNRTLPSLAVEMSVASPAKARAVTPPLCSAMV